MFTATEAGLAGSIQISGDRCFEPFRWREAILYYLNGVWSGRTQVMYRPKISLSNAPDEGSFASVVLRLDDHAKDYYAHGTSSGTAILGILPEEMLEVGDGQAEVEGALIRFVKNDQIKLLLINFHHRQGVGRVFLWKTDRRGDLGVRMENMPRSMDRAEIERFY